MTQTLESVQPLALSFINYLVVLDISFTSHSINSSSRHFLFGVDFTVPIIATLMIGVMSL